MKDFTGLGENFRQGKAASSRFSVTSQASLNWAWNEFDLLPSSAWIPSSTEDSSFKPLNCGHEISELISLHDISWKLYSICNGALLRSWRKTRPPSGTWRRNLLAVPLSTPPWSLLIILVLISPVPSLSLHFNHLYYKCPHKTPATFHPYP